MKQRIISKISDMFFPIKNLAVYYSGTMIISIILAAFIFVNIVMFPYFTKDDMEIIAFTGIGIAICTIILNLIVIIRFKANLDRINKLRKEISDEILQDETPMPPRRLLLHSDYDGDIIK